MNRTEAEQYLRSIYADMVRAVAQLLGRSPVDARVEFGNAAAVAEWGKQNAFHRRGAAAETANGVTVVSNSELENADKADLRGMIAHEVSHLYGTDEAQADAVRWAINGNAGSVKGSYDKWQVSDASKSYAESQGWSGSSASNTVESGGGGGGGGSTQASPGPSGGGTNNSTRGHSGGTGDTGGTGGGTGGAGAAVSAGVGSVGGAAVGAAEGAAGGGGGGGYGGAGIDSVNQAVRMWEAFLNGSITRNNFTKDQWDAMLAYANHIAPGGSDQPVLEIKSAMHQLNMDKEFAHNLYLGEQAGVWQKDKSTDAGIIYNNKYGEPGSGPAPGQTAKNPGAVQPPKAPGGGSQGQPKADFEYWLQQNGIHMTPAIQALVDEAHKKGWDKDQFIMAVEKTQQGQAWEHQQTVAKEGAYQTIVSDWQLGENANIKNLIHQAAVNGWSTYQFQQAIENTQEFQNAFPGIFNPNGTLKMSPTDYIAQAKLYQDYAERAGINLSDKRSAWLFRNDVSPSEFQDRSAALQSLRSNDQYFKAFNQQRRAMGLAPLSKQDMFHFVMGTGNQKWYDQWNLATTRYAGEQAGLSFGAQGQQGQYTHLSDKAVSKFEAKAINPATGQVDMNVLATDYTKLADYLSKTLPASKATQYGLTKKDFAEVAFGGPRAAAIQKRIDQLIANETDFTNFQAPGAQSLNPSMGQTRGGQQQKYGQGP